MFHVLKVDIKDLQKLLILEIQTSQFLGADIWYFHNISQGETKAKEEISLETKGALGSLREPWGAVGRPGEP